MTFQCPRCQERVKDWEGDDPKCGFDENGNFLENNWNCATLNALREQTDDFRDGYFDRGTLTYAQQILGDREPDNGFDGWEDSIFDEDEE